MIARAAMSRRDLGALVLLGALWGGSFLFMRAGALDFGPAALVFVRVAGAALLLLPLLAWQGQLGALRLHWRAIAVVGLVNSALPFVLFMVAALALSAGLMAIFNATAPIWAALIARLWLGEQLDRSRWLGLAIGVAGVVALSWDKADLQPQAQGVSAAVGIAACVAAAMFYGLAANYSRRRLAGVPPLAVAAGSQVGAALLMAGPALVTWPAVNPGPAAWAGAAVLALACTGLAYVLYFRLIASAGAANAIAVTFLIPGFAMFWGWLVLGEVPGSGMLAGGAVILLGTALATGVIRLPPKAAT
ncbi:Permease of the drug/metabolite transporter (DMT) superfamily [Rubrivivax sp. A210]|uniref:DMT family transporter n=1 Tax=Rubrivivax sp. A210 TaxID=2772301 RepID=UPI0019A36417|nr:DMT family transporter [Rubrivivax sp. A210]CAD5372250.1 Permease of the drug/metabolite transporter (DMT) superfamily [Rubrivivax sp. A210]